MGDPSPWTTDEEDLFLSSSGDALVDRKRGAKNGIRQQSCGDAHVAKHIGQQSCGDAHVAKHIGQQSCGDAHVAKEQTAKIVKTLNLGFCVAKGHLLGVGNTAEALPTL